MLSSQPELLFHEILHQKEPLVDSLAFYHFGTEQGGGGQQYKDENLDLDEYQEIPSESKRDGGDKQSFQFKFFHSVAPHNFNIYFEHFLKEQQQLHQ